MKYSDLELLQEAYKSIYTINEEETKKCDECGKELKKKEDGTWEECECSSKEDEEEGSSMDESVVTEAPEKKVSGKTYVNPWAVARAKGVSPKEEEKIVKGVKETAKKYGKKITSKGVKKASSK